MAGNSTILAPLGWLQIVRLGLVQTALGGIVVLTTSTLNRVMVVELALPAMLPGLLVAIHYAVQVLRPRWGYGSDMGARRTPWIIGGMAVLAIGGFLAAFATAMMADFLYAGLALAVLAFLMIGFGVGAAGTSLLVLLAKRVVPERRAAAATIVWVMMIAGFIVTAGTAGHFLDPFSGSRLIAVAGVVSLVAFAVAVLAIWGVEGSPGGAAQFRSAATPAAGPSFREALAEVWSENQSRHFTIFVFISMLAYSAQDLILEPYAGIVFGYTPGASTKLSGVQHGGVLAGMILVAVLSSILPVRWRPSLGMWTIGGCLASAVVLVVLAVAGSAPDRWPLNTIVFLLGLSNGAFAVAAIGSMMALAGNGRQSREGLRMGLWGAAQAIAFGVGGFLGAASVDVARLLVSEPLQAYALVFTAEAVLFLIAAALAAGIGQLSSPSDGAVPRVTGIGETLLPSNAIER